MTYYVSHAFAHNLLSFYKIKVERWINAIIDSLAVFSSIFQTKHLHFNYRGSANIHMSLPIEKKVYIFMFIIIFMFLSSLFVAKFVYWSSTKY